MAADAYASTSVGARARAMANENAGVARRVREAREDTRIAG